MQYARIIDKGECLSTLYKFPQIPWPKAFLKEVANKHEWAKHDFYPSNNLVGEISYVIGQDLLRQIDIDIYILQINEQFYVPMTRRGIEFISEAEYKRSRQNNHLKNMDEKQARINAFDDAFAIPNHYLKQPMDPIEIHAEIYWKSAKYAIVNNSQQAAMQREQISEDLISRNLLDVPYEEVIWILASWVKCAVRDCGWSINDEDGVSWWIGLYALAYQDVICGNDIPFEQLFKDIFVQYFKYEIHQG